MSKKIMINCDEASTICDKSQYCEASFFDKIRLQMHLFLCKKCGLYSEQNKMMSKIFNTHLVNHHHSGLTEEAKAELKEELEHQIN
jgi:glutamate synthase domain-containing protein 2